MSEAIKKILVIDDSATLRTQVLRVLSGFTTFEAEDGVQGLVAIKVHDPDLIICDVNMPELDGLSMLDKWSSDSTSRKVPVFMLTTESSADMKARGKMCGVIAWVTKPFSDEKLLAACKKVLGC